MTENIVTREEFYRELNTERRITMLETMTAEIQKNTVELRASNEDARNEYRAHQRFVLRVTATMVVAVVIAFSGVAFNAFSVNESLAELTIKVDRMDHRLESVESDVASLKTDVGMLQEGQARITAALLKAGIIE